MEQIKRLLTKVNENIKQNNNFNKLHPSQTPLLLPTKYKIYNNQEIHTGRNKFHI